MLNILIELIHVLSFILLVFNVKKKGLIYYKE